MRGTELENLERKRNYKPNRKFSYYVNAHSQWLGQIEK
jgi:hypothetical protein